VRDGGRAEEAKGRVAKGVTEFHAVLDFESKGYHRAEALAGGVTRP